MRSLVCAAALITTAAQAQYVGSKACAPCHSEHYRTWTASPMAQSLTEAAQVAVLRRPVQFLHSKTGRHYRIREGSIEEFFSNANARLAYSDTRRVGYAIGSGNHARSFLVEQSGRIYQAPVAYFARAGRWEMSPGYDTQDYVGFTRRVTANCLFCHAGRVNALNNAGDVFQTPLTFTEMAIGCERCHGPGQQHPAKRTIINPANLSAELRDQICEQCHLFGAARITQPGKMLAGYRPGQPLGATLAVYAWDAPAGEPSVTGHPQEMKESVCWKKSRHRLWCGSCHEVHASKAQVNAAFYRTKCLGCHAPASCKHDRENTCIACHMPKRPVAESAHVAFTDHRILRSPSLDIKPRLKTDRLRPILPAELDDAIVASRNLGFAYAEVAGSTGRPDFQRRVIELLRPLIGTGIADAAFWQTLGEAYLAAGEVGESEQAFRKAVALDPGSAGAQYSLGYLLQLRDELPEAVQAYRRAVKADPAKAEAFGNLAAAYLSMGEEEQALSALKTALALEPGNLKWRESTRR